MNFAIDNVPRFRVDAPPPAWQEVWYLKLNEPAAGRALWLRFTVLCGAAAKRVAEVWAISFDRGSGMLQHAAGKATHPLAEFRTERAVPGAVLFHIAGCHFGDGHTAGDFTAHGHRFRWDLSFTRRSEGTFDFVPDILRRVGMVKNYAVTVYEDLEYTGWTEVDGRRSEWAAAPGMQGHLAGARNGHSWCWGHCNTFVDASGAAAGIVWDGLCGRGRRGAEGASRALSTHYVHYQGEDHFMNGLWQAVRCKSAYSHGGWEFTARSGPLAFHGKITAKLGEYAGVTYEDTDGTHLYCANSKISTMTLEVLRNGKPEARFEANRSAAFEVVQRTPPEGVPLLI